MMVIVITSFNVIKPSSASHQQNIIIKTGVMPFDTSLVLLLATIKTNIKTVDKIKQYTGWQIDGN